MKSLLFFVLVLCMASCHRKDQSMTNNLSSNDSVKEIVNEPKNEQCISTLKFLGHDIICSKNSIPQELARICAKDDNLSFDSVNQNVTLYGTTFHLNYRNGVRGFLLMSSVQPDTRQIRIVRDAISKFHGKENFEEDWHYSWLPFTDSTKIDQNYPVIHLRRVHSEDGGTVIIVNYSQDVRNSIMKKLKVFLNVVIGIVIVILLLLFFCNYLVCSNAEGRLYTQVSDLDFKPFEHTL